MLIWIKMAKFSTLFAMFATCWEIHSTSMPMDFQCGNPTLFLGGVNQTIFPPWSAIIREYRHDTQNLREFGAIIVSPNLVMSSASNFVWNGTTLNIPQFKYFKVYVGHHDLWGNTKNVTHFHKKKFAITHMTLHPGYEVGTSWSSTRHPQILFHLNGTINLTPNIQPICLPGEDILDQVLLPGSLSLPITTGWNSKLSPEIFQMVEIQPQQICLHQWKYMHINDVYENRFCATVTKHNNVTPCIDTGVGTVRKVDKKFYIAGQIDKVVKSHSNCTVGVFYYFSKFTKETHSWIQNSMWCGVTKFTCGSGNCLPLYMFCNRFVNCPDGSDEVPAFCKYLYKCPEGEFYCGAGDDDKCIPDYKVNDGVKDCSNGEDEFDLIITPAKIVVGAVLAISVIIIAGTVATRECKKHWRYSRLMSTREIEIDSSPWKSIPTLICKELIGIGSFGKVYKALDLTNKAYAIKCVDIRATLQSARNELADSSDTSSTPDASLDVLLNEIQILSELRSDFILRYYWCWAEAQDSRGDIQLNRERLQQYIRQNLPTVTSTAEPISHIFIQTEFCHGTLTKYLTDIEAAEGVPENWRRSNILRIAQDLVSGLKYLHSKGYIHRDIKPGNILASHTDNNINSYTWKIGDFGLTVRNDYSSRGNHGKAGTEMYRSPEMMLGLAYSAKTDVYSLGLVFVEVVQQHANMFNRPKSFSRIRSFADDGSGRFRYLTDELTLNTHDNFVAVINRMLTIDSDNRPSASKLDSMIAFLSD